MTDIVIDTKDIVVEVKQPTAPETAVPPKIGLVEISQTIQRGSIWSTGSGAPANPGGQFGDMYLDVDTGNIYIWEAGGWMLVDTFAPATDTPAQVLEKLLTVDGVGSGLDADLLDGQHGSYYATQADMDAAEVVLNDHDARITTNTDNINGHTADITTNTADIATLNTAVSGLTTTVNLKANIASPTFTGDPKAPTPATGDNDTSIATTAFVKAQGYITEAQANTNYVNVAGDTMTGGLSFGNTGVADPQDNSRHIAMWGATYGFSVTSAQLNYNVSVTASHVFFSGVNELARLNSNTPVGPVLTVPKIRITTTNDINETSVTHPFQVGPDNGSNVNIDNNEITARNNGAGGALGINTLPGCSINMGNIDGSCVTTMRGSVNIATNPGAFNLGAFSDAGAGHGKECTSTLWVLKSSRSVTSSADHFQFYNPNGLVGRINTTGTSTSFTTTSDERLKTFTGEYDPEAAKAIILADPVRAFTWNTNGQPAIGWGAQTSWAVSHDLASPPEDPEADVSVSPWGMDLTARVPYLWAAMTGLLATVEALQARIDELEAALTGDGR